MARTVEVPEYEVQDGVRVDPSRTALIIGDMQNDFVTESGTLVVPGAEGTIPAIRNLLELARESDMRVVFVQDTHNDGDPEWEIWAMNQLYRHIPRATRWWEMHQRTDFLADQVPNTDYLAWLKDCPIPIYMVDQLK